MDKICVCKHFTSVNCILFSTLQHECSCIPLKDITTIEDLSDKMKFVTSCHSTTHVIVDSDKLMFCVCREKSAYYCARITNSNVIHECVCDLGLDCLAKKQHKCKCAVSNSWDDGYLDFNCYAEKHECRCKQLKDDCELAEIHDCICGNKNGCRCLCDTHVCICITSYSHCRSTTHDTNCYCLLVTHGPYRCRSKDSSVIHDCICHLGYKSICKIHQELISTN